MEEPIIDTEAILGSVRQAMGLSEDDISFDSELTLHINSALATLNQNGVGMPTVVKDASTTWEDFKDPEQPNHTFEHVKMYVFVKTKMLFDPPPPSNVKYMDDAANEMLWRLRESYDVVRKEVEPTGSQGLYRTLRG